MITFDDVALLVRRTARFTDQALARLDDTTVNVRPDLAGANSPYVIVTHAAAAFDYWTQHIICGHPTDRNRHAEFEAQGSVAEIRERLAATETGFDSLRSDLLAATHLAHVPNPESPLDAEWTVGAALLHAYEELAQHLGHLQLTVDLILSDEPHHKDRNQHAT